MTHNYKITNPSVDEFCEGASLHNVFHHLLLCVRVAIVIFLSIFHHVLEKGNKYVACKGFVRREVSVAHRGY